MSDKDLQGDEDDDFKPKITQVNKVDPIKSRSVMINEKLEFLCNGLVSFLDNKINMVK